MKSTSKWLLLTFILGAIFMGVSSFVAADEGGSSPHGTINVNMGHHGDKVDCSELKSTNYVLGNVTVGSNSSINIQGQIITIGVSAGATINVGYTDYVCSKCVFGCWFCNSCYPTDDHRIVTW